MIGSLLVMSGPSGCGKSTLLTKLFEDFDNYYFSISTTTRNAREGEVEGKDYYFISKEEFEADIKTNNFLEWAQVHGNYYGTSVRPIKDALVSGKLVILDIDVQGYQSIKEKFPHITTSVFITTPSLTILQERLYKRASDDEATIKRRLQNAKDEIQSIQDYDFIIVNDDLERSFEAFKNIANSTRHRVNHKVLEKFVHDWEIG